MNSDSPNPTDPTDRAEKSDQRENSFQGDPAKASAAAATMLPRWEMEAGMLLRCREWVDLFPWLRLLRVVRLAASPIWLAIVALTWLVWQVGISGLSNGTIPGGGFPLALAAAVPSDLLLPATVIGHGDAIGLVVWTALVWLPVAMALTHQGGRLTAGRDMSSLRGTFAVVTGRWLQALVASWIPLAIALPLWWMLAGVEGLLDWSGPTWWLDILTAPPLFLLSLVVAVIATLGKLAVPLAIAAVSLERDPDPLDALSRGYESVLRRFLATVCLVAWAAVLALIVVAGWAVVCGVAIQVLAPQRPVETFVWDQILVGRLGAGSTAWVTSGLAQLPAVVLVTTGWGMVGGVYLCLRQSAGGQEVEDLSVDDELAAPLSLPPVSRAEG